MSKPLPAKLRAKWDTLIATEGKRLGLARCRPFLENKIVNDIFYSGFFKDRLCIVKCSSKDPDSIENEYKILSRLHSLKPELFPEPFCFHITPDRDMAFIAIEKIEELSAIDSTAALNDAVNIIEALLKENIIHRDIYRDNFFFSSNGHLCLFDFQFAVDATDPKISKWLQRHWKYHYVIFARVNGQPAATWNDVTAMRRFIQRTFPDAPGYHEADAKLARMEASANYRADIPLRILPLACAYAVSLSFQHLFCRNKSRKAVIGKRRSIVHDLIKAACSATS